MNPEADIVRTLRARIAELEEQLVAAGGPDKAHGLVEDLASRNACLCREHR